MSLKTRFGNLKNVLDEDSSQTEILVLESPFIANGEFDDMVRQFGEQRVAHRLHLCRGWTEMRWPASWSGFGRRQRMRCALAPDIWC